MDRSHLGGLQCTWTVTFTCLIFQLLSFVYFHTLILWVDRSHEGGVQCRWTITFACLIFELLPFVYFHTWIYPEHTSKTILAVYKMLWVDRSHQGGVQCTWTLTLAYVIFELLSFVYFHFWILSGAYLQDYTSYCYEISWMVTTWGKRGVFCNNLPLLF